MIFYHSLLTATDSPFCMCSFLIDADLSYHVEDKDQHSPGRIAESCVIIVQHASFGIVCTRII